MFAFCLNNSLVWWFCPVVYDIRHLIAIQACHCWKSPKLLDDKISIISDRLRKEILLREVQLLFIKESVIIQTLLLPWRLNFALSGLKKHNVWISNLTPSSYTQCSKKMSFKKASKLKELKGWSSNNIFSHISRQSCLAIIKLQDLIISVTRRSYCTETAWKLWKFLALKTKSLNIC